MKRWMLTCIVLLALASGCTARAVPPPYRVAPRSHDAYCAIATSQIAQGELMTAGLIDPNKVVDGKTEIQLLAKKRLFKGIWEQVYRLVLHQSDGKSISVITVSTGYYGECPGDHVKTYVISRALGELPSLQYLPNEKDAKP